MKIAILNNLPHQFMGGVEKYTQLLALMSIKNGWDVHEYSIVSPKGLKQVSKKIPIIHQHDISFGAKNYPLRGFKKMEEIINDDNFDVVIGNTIVAGRSAFKSSKFIQVQHMDNRFYTYKSAFKWWCFFNSVFLGMGSWRDPLKLHNVIFFTMKHDNEKVANAGYIPIPLDPEFGWRTEPRKGEYVYWIARHSEPQKGLKNLNKVYSYSNEKKYFRIGGDGPDSRKIKVPSENKVGNLTSVKVRDALDSSSVFIMTSNIEGFAFTVVEALSRGVPVVLYNTFLSAEFFNECKGVFLIDKFDHKKFAETVDNIHNLDVEDWNKLSKECIQFSKKHFGIDKFNKDWTNYIKSL